MASATTVLSAGIRTSAASSTNRTAVTAISAGVFATAAPYAASSGINSDASSSLKAWLPPQRVRLVDDNGLMSVAWYKFFQFVADVKLGGANAPTVGDLSTNVVSVKQEAVLSGAMIAAIAVQAAANAIALEVTKQVVQNNALSGAAQIPPVQLGWPQEHGE